MKNILAFFLSLVIFSSTAHAVLTPARNISVTTNTFSHCLKSSDTDVQTSLDDIDSCFGGLSSYNFIDSLVNVSGNVSLVNDTSTSLTSEYYGWNASGKEGFFALPNSMVYPGTGIAVSTGSAWTTSIATNYFYPASNPNSYIPLTALSSTMNGLTYNNTSGVFSLTNGYYFPTTTDESNWNAKQSALTFSDSLVNSSNTVTLVNDSSSPSASQYYGTNASSTLGYYNLPSGIPYPSCTGIVTMGASSWGSCIASNYYLPASKLGTVTSTDFCHGDGSGNVTCVDGNTYLTSTSAWLTLGNSGTVDGTNFIGTTDDVPLTFRVDNQQIGKLNHDNSDVFFGIQAGDSGQDYTNSFGSQAGYQATNGSFSNYLGVDAGNGTTNSSDANFFGGESGNGATNASDSNFFGFMSGYYATNAFNSTFMGDQAGLYAVNSYNSFFVGTMAGATDRITYGSQNANNSIFLGNGAGAQAADLALNNSGGHTSILIGDLTSTGGYSDSIGIGKSAKNSDNYQFILYLDGSQYADLDFNYDQNIMGLLAGHGITNTEGINWFGQSAGYNAYYAGDTNFLGFHAGYAATWASGSNFMGAFSGLNATYSFNSECSGIGSCTNSPTINNGIVIGSNAGAGDTVNNNFSIIYTNLVGNFQTGETILDTTSSGTALLLKDNGSNQMWCKNAGTINLSDSIKGLTSGATAKVSSITAQGTTILIGDNTNTGGFSNSACIGANCRNTAVNQLMVAPSYQPTFPYFSSAGFVKTNSSGAESVDTNSYQTVLTFGNLTDAGTDGITVSGGTGAVIGTGTSLSQHIADVSDSGYLSSTDWGTFNGKQPNLSLLKGTYSNGDVCTYTASGTLLNCNTSPSSLGTNYWTRNSVSGYLYPTTTTDFVGIGVATPYNRLEVAGGTVIGNGYVGQGLLSSSNSLVVQGRIGAGTNLPISEMQVIETSTNAIRGLTIDQYSSDTTSSRITARKARGTLASPTIVVTGDNLASWSSYGYDGANFIESARALITSTGTIGTGVIPSTMALQTMNSSGTLTSGLTISASQAVALPGYTTNGFVKFTSGNGSLGVDTSSYFVLPTLTSGSVLFSNGTTITQDNANFYWDDSFSPAGSLQIGAHSGQPEDATLETYANSGNVAHFHYTGSGGAFGGAIVDFSAVNGVARASGDRLGSIQFAGSYDSSNTPGIGAAINGFATQTWTSTHAGGQLVFNTVPNDSTTRTTALTLNQDQTAQFNAYTTNGFVKFTGSNGTLGVDTNTYSTQTFGTLTNGDWCTTNGTSISCNTVAPQAAYTNLTSIGSLTDGTGWLHDNGSGTFAYSTPTLANVTGSGATTSTASTFSGGLTASGGFTFGSGTGLLQSSSGTVANNASGAYSTNNYLTNIYLNSTAEFTGGNAGRIGVTGTFDAYTMTAANTLTLAAGTTTTAPLIIPSGTNLTTTAAGALENSGTHLYFTFANSGTRYQLDQQSNGVSSVTSGGLAADPLANPTTGAIIVSESALSKEAVYLSIAALCNGAN